MSPSAPLSVIIPALDAAASLPATLAALAEGRALIRDIIVADGGSRDTTSAITEAAGATLVTMAKGRGGQLAAAAAAAAGEWLFFLHADTRPLPGWSVEVARFIADPANRERAGYFTYRLDDAARAARRLERIVAWRSRVLGLPYGDQGLVLARTFYQALGGFPALPLMEDVAFVRRIGRGRLVALATGALTSADRYRRGGYLWRPLRNLGCLTLYLLGLPPRLILRLYG
ncbi:MAG TPA: TIGR04283 family arsenosugar biosynthesis glycosyltransferase [Stellaceae bacterium]|nr:TIGR04283 family arsenosugar biosynthesis glycosyltransferase [Stellaceae bacterium]